MEETENNQPSIIRRGGEVHPMIVIYGHGGIGKTSLAARSKNPIIFDLDDGSNQIDADRVPKSEFQTWDDLVEKCQDFLSCKKSKKGLYADYDTLVIDTLDRGEALCHEYICSEEKSSSIEKVGNGFGKGQAMGVEKFRRFFQLLQDIRRYAMVIVIAHQTTEKVRDLNGQEWERFNLKVTPGLRGLVTEAFDAIFFARAEVIGKKTDKNGNHSIGIMTGRQLETRTSGAWNVKSRYSMPPSIPLTIGDSSVFYRCFANDPATLRARIEEIIASESSNEKLVAGMKKALEKAGENRGELRQVLDRYYEYIASR